MSQEVARLRSALMRVTAALTLDGAQAIAREALGSQSTNKISKRGMRSPHEILSERNDVDLPHEDVSKRKFCLCSDPAYCLRSLDDDTRARANQYRKAHGAPTWEPDDAQV